MNEFTKIKILKNHDALKAGDVIFAGSVGMALSNALVIDGKAEIVKPVEKAASKKKTVKKEVKKDANSSKDRADS